MNASKVAVLMGSDSDWDVMSESVEALKEFGIAYEVRVLSAHRSPDLVRDFVLSAEGQGIRLIIAGAGGAAHLAGVVAAHTRLPVIGVPIASTSLNGLDSLLATVQMPAGIPVATVAVGKAGARNAGILAAEILALADTALAEKLVRFKKQLADGVRKKNEKLQDKLNQEIH